MINRTIIHYTTNHYIVRYKGADNKMEKQEFKDRLFDLLNDADTLPIQDLDLDDKNDILKIYFKDKTRFLIHIENCGNWEI